MITYDLERRGTVAKYEYLYQCIRRDIRSGVIAGGTRLPSKRALAAHLSVSVGTVEQAYDLLVSGGYVNPKQGSGFYVQPGRAGGSAPMPDEGREAPDAEPDAPIDFKANKCSLGLFPAETWARIMRRTLSERNPILFETVPFNGLEVLRRAIASYLYEFRGISTSPECIVIGAGTEYLYGRLLQLLGRESVIAIGDPGYKKLADVSRSFGTLWDYIPVDEEGLVIDHLKGSMASVVHVSPANHFPTGAVMSQERREALLEWVAEKPQRFIIEDDYDSELRFSGRALPPLATQDTTNSTIYLNTFSKTLVPSIRISYLVLPEVLMDLYRRQMSFYSCTVSSFEQCALAEFISRGYFERHISRLRRYYDKQRSAIIQAFENSPLTKIAQVRTVSVGTHLLVDVRTHLSDGEIRAAALERGMRLAMLSDYCVHPTARYARSVVINFASIEPDQVSHAVGLLVDVFREDIERPCPL